MRRRHVSGQESTAKSQEQGWPQELLQLLQEGRDPGTVEILEGSGDDPLERLAGLMERARREESGAGGEAMRRLEGRIHQARELPKPVTFVREDRPLKRLEARARGEEIQARAEGGELAEEVQSPQRPAEANPAGEDIVGQALLKSLHRRPLSGPVRAEVAARLAGLLQGPLGEEVEPIWNLVVFGGDGNERAGE